MILVRYRLGWIDVYLRFPSFKYVAKNWFGPRKMTTKKFYVHTRTVLSIDYGNNT